MNPKISVIIPIFNSGSNLRQCIESVLNQDYTDIELILIDDGSYDNSADICKIYAKLDKRVHYYYKQNGGVSSARNYGLTKASGKWINFIDSDDWISPKTYSTILDFEKKNSSQLLIWGINIYRTGKVIRSYCYQSIHSTSSLRTKEVLIKTDMFGLLESPCNKLYLSNIIKDNFIKFDINLNNFEDMKFNCDYIQNTTCISVLDTIFYNYRQEVGSNSLSSKLPDNIYNITLESISLRKKVLISNNKILEKEYDDYLLKKLELIKLLSILKLYSSDTKRKKRLGMWKKYFFDANIKLLKTNVYYPFLYFKSPIIAEISFYVIYTIKKLYLYLHSINRNKYLTNK